jgi:Multicopper oxidase
MRDCNSYRFRLVSISCDPSYVFSIDGHQMTVIEVEGTNVQPLLVDQIEIFVGACQCDSKTVICSIDQLQNRSTLLGCRKILLFILCMMVCLTCL